MSELTRIAQGVNLMVLGDAVDRAKLELALRNGQYDAVHLATHGELDGVELSDGTLGAVDLVSMLSFQTHLGFVVINACNSVAVGICLHNALHVPVVAHDAPITDGAAITFAESFYRALRSPNMGLEQAFERAVRVLQLRYAAEARTPQLINGDMASLDGLRALRREIELGFARFDERLGRVEEAMGYLHDERSRVLQYATVALLAALLAAQILTPVMQALLR